MTINLKSLISKLDRDCQRSLEAAAGLCLSRSHYTVETEHWLLKLLEDPSPDLEIIFSKQEIDINLLKNDLLRNLDQFKTGNAQPPALSQRIVDLIQEALLLASLEFSVTQINRMHILYALFKKEGFKECVKNINTPALDQFTINLTELARQGKIDSVIGREAEVRQIIDILMRRRQNNPILTGEPGVGKTAVVEGFAVRIAEGDVPPALQNVAVHTLDLGLLQAGAGIKGEFEQRLKSVIQEVKSSPHPIILFIDEAHTLIGAGAQAGQGDAANLLKPALARGELRTIAATTWTEYKKYFEQDAALARRFQVIKIEEASEGAAIKILRGLIIKLEQHHDVLILDEAILAAVRLSQRYLAHRQLPDKAISVLDTACARVAIRTTTENPAIEDCKKNLEHLETEITFLKREKISAHSKRIKNLQKQQNILQKKLIYLEKKTVKKALSYEVNAQVIAEVIAEWTGIPLGRMLNDEIYTVLKLEENLQKRIKGQTHALTAIAQSIRTSHARLTDPCKPIGVFLLLGPSGVGKTETALALAELLYGGEQNMTTINLSEFKEAHKVSLLLGSPPGYVGYGEGGILTEAIRRRPYSLILLDEVEKAHPGVHDIFYQVFDKGILRDGQGRDVDFKNTLIILTSNVGSHVIHQLSAQGTVDIMAAVRPELLKVFKPAFLGRITPIPYLPLNDDLLQQIVQLQLQRIQRRIHDHYQAKFTYDSALVNYITARCQEVETGARLIDHFLNRRLLPDLSTQFLACLADNKKISAIHVQVEEGKFVYEMG